MGRTNAGLAMMGFQGMGVADVLEACFHRLHVFEVRGLVIGNDAVPQIAGEVSGIPYQLGFGDSINAICQNLVGDKFTDNEAQWIEDRNANAPFAVVHLGPTAFYQCKSAFWKKEEDGSITTVDSFAGARDEIEKQEEVVLPPLLAALECSFSANRHPVRFIPIEEARYDITKNGKTIRNLRFLASGTLSASTGISPDDFSSMLLRAINAVTKGQVWQLDLLRQPARVRSVNYEPRP